MFRGYRSSGRYGRLAGGYSVRSTVRTGVQGQETIA